MPASFDIIITGGGCAGLSLAYQIHLQPALKGKKVLIIDKDEKAGNDRTWCFWESEIGPFESVVCQQWEQAWFFGPAWQKNLDLKPFRYKMIRSADFYQFVKNQLEQNPDIQFLQSEVLEIKEEQQVVNVKTGDGQFVSALVFTSIPQNQVRKAGEFYLLQHFMGWFLEMEKPVFNPQEPVLMDFRIPQEGDCRFMYVLPQSPTKALVEYTLFSLELLEKGDYRAGIKAYLEKHYPETGWKIEEEEYGVIPMFSESQNEKTSERIIPIGTAGGATKASTGYTFTRIQKHSVLLANHLASGRSLSLNGYRQSIHHQWFDRVLLHVLHQENGLGVTIFEGLFRNNAPASVFRFLDEKSSTWEEWNIMQSVPISKFIKPGVKEFWKLAKR